MLQGIVSSGDKAFFRFDTPGISPLIENIEESQTLAIWKEALTDNGFIPDDFGLKPEHLFDLAKDAFEKRLNCKLEASKDRKYIASLDGKSPVKHDDSSRIFASEGIVYIDELMVSILFDYVANYYVWARY